MAFVELEKVRELLFELRNECIASNVKEDTTRGVLYSINELEKLPAADVVEVKHGGWILLMETLDKRVLECSSCKYVRRLSLGETFPELCEKCGAKMDGRRET